MLDPAMRMMYKRGSIDSRVNPEIRVTRYETLLHNLGSWSMYRLD
jgi:hypothetical protein